MTQQAQTFSAPVTRTVERHYLLHLPPGYDAASGQTWPLILFLHGMGERGNNLELVKLHGIARVVEQQPNFPFITVSPQCPGDSTWAKNELENLNALLDTIIAQNAVDTSRVYLTGLSMGGFGTWHLATMYPQRFAAIAPVCGGGSVQSAARLKDMPIWAFHGALDDVVPPRESETMVAAVRESGGNPRLTIYPDANHNSWTRTYDNPALYDWFMEHQRK